jgi:hypothetical protein
MNYLPRLASNHNPLDISLPSNSDYRHEPRRPASGIVLSNFLLETIVTELKYPRTAEWTTLCGVSRSATGAGQRSPDELQA